MSRLPRSFAAISRQWRMGVCCLIGIVSLSHGTRAHAAEMKSFTVRVVGRQDDTGKTQAVMPQQVDSSISTTRKRLAALGLPKPRIERRGNDGFVVRWDDLTLDPGTDIAELIRTVGRLELREVSPRTDEAGPDGKPFAQRVLDGSEILPGYCAYTHKVKHEDGRESKRPLLLNRRTAITNPDIASAIVSPQHQNGKAVAVTLNREGADKMIALTRNMRPGRDRIAILIDGEINTAPVVNSVPLGKNFVLEGFNSAAGAATLAAAFVNPLECQLIVEEVSTAPTPDPIR